MSPLRGRSREGLALRLLRAVLAPGPGAESIVGDLIEEHRSVAARRGALAGSLWLWWQTTATAWSMLRPGRATLDRLGQDITLSLRGIRRDPGFASAVVVTLALGVGAGSAIFSVVDGVLLRALPYPDADRLVRVWVSNERTGDDFVDWMYGDLEAVRAGGASFASVAGLSVAPRTLMDERGERGERITVGRATPDLFEVLGVQPRLGRLFDGGDAAVGRQVVVLSYGLWTRRFGAESDVIGRMVHLDSRAFEVVGVLPEGAGYPEAAGLWRPLGPDDTDDDDREMSILARLAPDAPPAIASAEVAAVAAGLAQSTPESHGDLTAWVQPLQAMMVRDVRTALLALLGAVGLVLAIACLNTANLFLARATRKREEAAIRSALGAGRRRIAAAAVVDSLVLAALGGVLGLVVGRWALGSMLAVSPRLPRMEEIALDLRVMVVMGTVTTAAAVAFAVLPLLFAPAPLEQALRSGGPHSTRSSGARRLQSGLVGMEIALSTVLAVMALLLATTFRTALTFDRGFDARGLITVTVDPMHPPEPGDATRAYFNGLTEGVERSPGVTGAALASHSLLQPRGFRVPVAVEGMPEITPTPLAWINIVSRDFFEVAGIALAQGRTFSDVGGTDDDTELVVNESFVRTHLSAVGRVLGVPVQLEWVAGHIVGVVGDVTPTPGEPALPKAYVSFDAVTFSGAALTVRGSGDVDAVVEATRAAIRELGGDVLIEDLTLVEQAVRGSVAPERFNMILVVAFAGLALALAAIGVYGVTALTVTSRRGELGVCRALGASDRRVVLDVLRGVGTVTTLGLGAGLLGAVAGGRLVQGLLLGVTPTDPVVLAAVTGLVGTVAVVGALLPARRALGVHPTSALRSG